MGFLLDIKNSLISISSYRDFSVRPLKTAIRYLVIIAMITGIPAGIDMQQYYTAKIKHSLGDYSSSVWFDEAHIVQLWHEDEALAGSATVITHSGISPILGLEMTLPGVSIDATGMKKLAPYMGIISVIVFIFCFIGIALYKLIIALVMSVVCMAIAQIKRANLDFKMGFNITCYAMTLPLIVQGLQVLLAPEFKHPDMIFYGPLLIYQYLAVIASRSLSETATGAEHDMNTEDLGTLDQE